MHKRIFQRFRLPRSHLLAPSPGAHGLKGALVENGRSARFNVHGLYEVRYDGEKLDDEAKRKLLRAFNDFRSSNQ